MIISYNAIIEFWFSELKPSQWWYKDTKFDHLIANRFSRLHEQAKAGELLEWRVTSEGRLAEIIVLDQFSRNIFRGSPEAFSSDSMALALAQEAVSHGADQQVSVIQRPFFYLPFMHSESLFIHQLAEKLYQQLGDSRALDYELKHKAIIEKFGRYPHRNIVLGRESSPAELAFFRRARLIILDSIYGYLAQCLFKSPE